MPFAHANPVIVVDYINTEVKERRVVGPLVRHNSPGVHISRFGVIPKHNQPGKWRLILDLSYPKDRSVNAGISKPLYSLQYASVDDARIITDLGPQTQLAKIDIAGTLLAPNYSATAKSSILKFFLALLHGICLVST